MWWNNRERRWMSSTSTNILKILNVLFTNAKDHPQHTRRNEFSVTYINSCYKLHINCNPKKSHTLGHWSQLRVHYHPNHLIDICVLDLGRQPCRQRHSTWSRSHYLNHSVCTSAISAAGWHALWIAKHWRDCMPSHTADYSNPSDAYDYPDSRCGRLRKSFATTGMTTTATMAAVHRWNAVAQTISTCPDCCGRRSSSRMYPHRWSFDRRVQNDDVAAAAAFVTGRRCGIK